MFSQIYQVDSEGTPEDYNRRIVEALETNNCLREFHLKAYIDEKLYPHLSIIIEHLCRNESLSEVTIDLYSELVGELQLCVSSIHYLTCLHLEWRKRGSIPSSTKCFSLLDYPFQPFFHTMYVFLTACTVSLMPWFIQPISIVTPITPQK